MTIGTTQLKWNHDFSTALSLIFGAQASVFTFGNLTSRHIADFESDTLTR